MASNGDLASVPDLDQDRRLSWQANLVKQHMMSIAQTCGRGVVPQLKQSRSVRKAFCELDSSQMVCAFGSCQNLHAVFIAIQQAHRTLQFSHTCVYSGEITMLEFFLVYRLQQVVGHLEYRRSNV